MSKEITIIGMIFTGFFLWGIEGQAEEISVRPIDRIWRMIEEFQFDNASQLIAELDGDQFDELKKLISVITLANGRAYTEKINRRISSELEVLSLYGSEEVKPVAMYLLGRHHSFNPINPDIRETFYWYEKLIAEHREHFFGQLACLKLANIILFYSQNEESVESRISEALKYKEFLRSKEILVVYDLMIGDAVMFHSAPPQIALDHYISAYKNGIASERRKKDILIQIGEAALLVEEYDVAIQFFSEFLELFPNEKRTYTVFVKREKLLHDKF